MSFLEVWGGGAEAGQDGDGEGSLEVHSKSFGGLGGYCGIVRFEKFGWRK